MERVSDLLANARENRRRQGARRQARASAAPSPMQASGQIHQGAYAALMRSHDRVQSRHVGGKGGAGGA